MKDAQVGWKAILNDPQHHLGGGVAQYDYMESLLNRLSGQARKLLHNCGGHIDDHQTQLLTQLLKTTQLLLKCA